MSATFAEFIRHERETRKMNLQEFADLCKVSRETVRLIESGVYDQGKTLPNLRVLARLRFALGVSFDYMASLILPDEVAPLATSDPERIKMRLFDASPDLIRAIDIMIDGDRLRRGSEGGDSK